MNYYCDYKMIILFVKFWNSFDARRAKLNCTMRSWWQSNACDLFACFFVHGSGLIILIATTIIKIQNLFASFFSGFERGIFTMWHFRWLVQFPSPRKDHFWISQQIDKRTFHFGQFCALRASLGNFGKYYDYNGCYHGWKGEPFDAGAAFNFPPKN